MDLTRSKKDKYRLAFAEHEVEPTCRAVVLWGGLGVIPYGRANFGVWQIYTGLMGGEVIFNEVTPDALPRLCEILDDYEHHIETFEGNFKRETDNLVSVPCIKGRQKAEDVIDYGKAAGALALDIELQLCLINNAMPPNTA